MNGDEIRLRDRCSIRDIEDEQLSLIEPRNLGLFSMEKARSRKRCRAAGYFVVSTMSLFAGLTYAVIYMQIAEFSMVSTVIVPMFWMAVSLGNMWNAAESFYKLDVNICEDYYEKALEEAKKQLRVVDETDMGDHCPFQMRQIGVTADETAEVRG